MFQAFLLLQPLHVRLLWCLLAALKDFFLFFFSLIKKVFFRRTPELSKEVADKGALKTDFPINLDYNEVRGHIQKMSSSASLTGPCQQGHHNRTCHMSWLEKNNKIKHLRIFMNREAQLMDLFTGSNQFILIFDTQKTNSSSPTAWLNSRTKNCTSANGDLR